MLLRKVADSHKDAYFLGLGKPFLPLQSPREKDQKVPGAGGRRRKSRGWWLRDEVVRVTVLAQRLRCGCGFGLQVSRVLPGVGRTRQR